jgi:hypothetical protein
LAETPTKGESPPYSSGTTPSGNELLLDAFQIGIRLVYFGNRHDQGHVGRLGVMDRFLGLRHDAVIGGHHQDDQVGRLGAARPHRRKGFVARRIEEGDHAAGRFDVVGTDVLRDAAGLAVCHATLADVVEQRGLAVVDVTHDRDHRSPRQLHHVLVLAFVGEEGIGIVELGGECLVAHFLDHDHRGFLVQHLVDGHHRSHLHQGLDDLGRLDRHLVCQIGDRNRLRHMHFAHDGLDRLRRRRVLGVAMAPMAPAALGTTPAGGAGIAPSLDRAPLGGIILPGILLCRLRLAILRLGGRLVDRAGNACRSSRLLAGFLGLGGGELCLLLGKACLRLGTSAGFALALFLEFGRLNGGQLALTLRFGFAQCTLRRIDHRPWRSRWSRDRSLGHNLGRGLYHRRFDHHRSNFDHRHWSRFRHHDHRLDGGNFGRGLGCGFRREFIGITLDEHPLLADLDLDRARLAGGIRRTDFRCLFARQCDLGLGRRIAVRLAQIVEQLGLVLLGQGVVGGLLADAGLRQLLKQGRRRHFQLGSELRNSHQSHAEPLILLRQTSGHAQQ